MSTRTFSFIGGDTGVWRVVNTEVIVGPALPAAKRLAIVAGSEIPSEPPAAWVLRGITSNERYTDREERRLIVAKLLDLGRPESKCAALIPIRKNETWWALTQEERLSIFKENSHLKFPAFRYATSRITAAISGFRVVFSLAPQSIPKPVLGKSLAKARRRSAKAYSVRLAVA